MSEIIVKAGSWICLAWACCAAWVTGQRVAATWSGAAALDAANHVPGINASVAQVMTWVVLIIAIISLVFRQVALARSLPGARARGSVAVGISLATLCVAWVGVMTR